MVEDFLHHPEKRQQIAWLLKDKYEWSTTTIHDFLASKILQQQKISKSIAHDLHRLEQGEPLAYVIGWVDFLGCRIDLSLRPLIPRPETEYWVGEIMKNIQHMAHDKPTQVLDLCCGSGCIGIAVLKHLPNCVVDFVDISERAIEQTKKNLQANNLPLENYSLKQSDVFEKVIGSYNFIFCNPPYVDQHHAQLVDLAFEPSTALFADEHGLTLIGKILRQTKQHLLHQGQLMMEFGKGQEENIQRLAESNHLACTFYPDQYGVLRYGVFK